MKQIKMFNEAVDEERLEEKVNDYLSQLDSSYSVIDIKYNVHLDSRCLDIFTAMVIYEQH